MYLDYISKGGNNMDYLKLIKGLKNEVVEEGRAKYKNMFLPIRLLFTLIFIPLRIAFCFTRIGYWLTYFFFKALATPVDYLQSWLKAQREGLAPATEAILYFVCMPTIFGQQVMLAFNSFTFFFQWVALMLQAYIMTLGAIRWQPIINDATFE